MLNLKTESKYFGLGYNLVAGVDEAGRGPLAGPVVAAAVVIGPDFQINDDDLALINDSKQLTAKRREHLFGVIKAKARAVAIGVCDNRTIDKINILQASFLAMRRALKALPLEPDFIILDGRFKIPKLTTPQTAIIKGDSKVWAVAAASIIAKVSRDWIITELDKEYPAYGFAQHKGYGTKLHLAKLTEHGPCPIHRFSFAPVREAAKNK